MSLAEYLHMCIHVKEKRMSSDPLRIPSFLTQHIRSRVPCQKNTLAEKEVYI
jgi:hypothetical protein